MLNLLSGSFSSRIPLVTLLRIRFHCLLSLSTFGLCLHMAVESLMRIRLGRVKLTRAGLVGLSVTIRGRAFMAGGCKFTQKHREVSLLEANAFLEGLKAIIFVGNYVNIVHFCHILERRTNLLML